MAPHQPYRFDLAVDAQLGEDVLHVTLNGERTDPEVAGDIGGGAPFCERAQDLQLPLGQHG